MSGGLIGCYRHCEYNYQSGGSVGTVYGGACDTGVTGSANIVVTGGTVQGSVYGVNPYNSITGVATVKISVDATIDGDVYLCASDKTVGEGSTVQYEVAFYNGTTTPRRLRSMLWKIKLRLNRQLPQDFILLTDGLKATSLYSISIPLSHGR